MKNGKNLTRTQKLVLLSRGLDPKERLISKKLPDMWLLVHRRTNRTFELWFDKTISSIRKYSDTATQLG
ncbi:DUF6906 family protein [Brevibacillus thermoruber]|uniref:DUF6906 family protein n=1 Tax=Brevibacillus thermoruber TaxID=33942 RepID=UPI000557FF43